MLGRRIGAEVEDGGGSVQQRAGQWAWFVVSLSIAARSKLSLTRDPCRPPLPVRLGSCVKGTGGDDSVSLVACAQ